MTNSTKFTRVATAAVGAILISTACIAAAVGPGTSAGQSQAYAALISAQAKA